MRIGITLGLTKDHESLWINGIKLNAIYLANTLKQIEGNEVFLLDTSHKVEDLSKVVWDIKEFPIYKFANKIKEVDLLITLGTSLPSNWVKAIKKINPNAKVVKYQCGNNYVVDMERVLFGKPNDPGIPAWDRGHDATWLIPQQEYQNLEYFKTVYNQADDQVKVVPFIWDPMFIDSNRDSLKRLGKKIPKYIPKNRSDKKISVMEPNLNVVKYALIPILIAEKVFRNFGENPFKQIWIASGERMLKNNYFKGMLKQLDIVKTKIPLISFVPRYPVATMLAEETDIVISHQWENPLNYSYLDAIHFGYPMVHNAEMIKDAGYYYKDFNISDGAKQLEYALNDHDQNIKEYAERNKKVLWRYTSTNPELVDTYRKLIENLFEPGKHKLSYKYNPKTNLYK
jgi:hypothetical protein|tara:strand:- start:892 stop:2088 length:1197 start_codon:yes stop_codon:yes gene_type:complete